MQAGLTTCLCRPVLAAALCSELQPLALTGQANGSFAVLVLNNIAGDAFTARISFGAIAGMDASIHYDVRDLYKRKSTASGVADSFLTDTVSEHDSRMYLFTPTRPVGAATAATEAGGEGGDPPL